METGQAHSLFTVSLSSWSGGKDFIERASAVSPDALHMIVGLAIFLGAAWLLRKPAGSIWPWLTTAALLAVNEALDLAVERWPSRSMQYGESFKDLAVTMAAPTLIVLAVRFMPRLFDPVTPEHREDDARRREEESQAPATGED